MMANEQMPETINCTFDGCDRKMYYKPDGKYGPFYSHKVSEGVYHNVDADKVDTEGWMKRPGSTPSGQTRERVEQPDWDEIARGKVRCQVATAYIKAGQFELNPPIREQMGLWVDWIMGTKGEDAEEVDSPF